jgi:competence protein ComEC
MLGIVLYQYQVVPLSMGMLLLTCLGAWAFIAAISMRKYKRPQRWIFGLLIGTGMCLLGFSNSQFSDPRQADDFIGHSLDSTNTILVRLCDEPRLQKRLKVPVELIAQRQGEQTLRCSGKLMLYIQRDSLSDSLQLGDILWLEAKLILPPAARNPGHFDYRKYLSQQHIYYQAFINSGAWKKVCHQAPGRIKSFALNCRNKAMQLLDKYIEAPREQAVASALIIGYQKDLDPETRQAYVLTGAMHILAVSGMHVGLLAGIIQFLGLKVFGAKRRGKIISTVVSIICICLFALVTGLTASVNRAALMFCVMLLGNLLFRKTNIWNTMGFAALLLLLIEPMTFYDLGFQLSFAAVAGIVYMQHPIYRLYMPGNRLSHWVWNLTSVSLAAQLGTMPISLFYFHQFPMYFWLSGFWGIPLSTLVLPLGMVYFALYWVPYLGYGLGRAIEWTVWLQNEGITRISQLPYALVEGYYPTLWMLVVAYLGIFYLGQWLWYKTGRYLVYMLACVCVLMGLSSYQTWQKQEQSHVVLYQLRQHMAFEQVQGQRSTLYTVGKANTWQHELDSARMHLVRQAKLKHTEVINLDSAAYRIDFKGTRYFIPLGGKNKLQYETGPIDKVILPNNTSYRNRVAWLAQDSVQVIDLREGYWLE